MSVPAEQVDFDFDDIDLDIDPAEEIRKLSQNIEEETKAETTTSEEDTPAEEAAEDKPKTEESVTEEEAEEEAEEEVVAEAEAEEQPTVAEDSTPKEAVNDVNSVLAELRAEKQRLQDQLTELEIRARLGDERVAKLETSLQPKEEEVQEPTAEEILAYVDQQIGLVETKLSQAENEDPSQAPQLRRQLRQLERYYNDFSTQQKLMAAKGPDPRELVEQASQEVQYKASFDSTRQAITHEYPLLDKDSEYFNPGMRDAVMEVYQPMINAGKDPTEALIKATTLVMRSNGIPSISEYQAMEAKKAKEAAKAEPTKPVPEKKAAVERKQAQVEKNLAAAKATPPNIAQSGVPNDRAGLLEKYDFEKMPLEDFMKLTEEQEAQIEKALYMYNE